MSQEVDFESVKRAYDEMARRSLEKDPKRRLPPRGLPPGAGKGPSPSPDGEKPAP